MEAEPVVGNMLTLSASERSNNCLSANKFDLSEAVCRMGWLVRRFGCTSPAVTQNWTASPTVAHIIFDTTPFIIVYHIFSIWQKISDLCFPCTTF